MKECCMMDEKKLKKQNEKLLRLLKAMSINFLFTAEGKMPSESIARKIALDYIEVIKKLEAEIQETE